MLDSIVTNKTFITFFLFSPFAFLILFYIGTRITKGKATSALVVNIAQTAILYNLTHLLLVVLIFLGGKDIYNNIFYGDTAQIFWYSILLSLAVNIYLDFTNYNARALVIQLLILIVSVITVIAITKAVIPGIFFMFEKINFLITDLASIRPR